MTSASRTDVRLSPFSQHVPRQTALDAQQPKQQVFASNVGVEKPLGFLDRALNDLPGIFAERHLGGVRDTRLERAASLMNALPDLA